MMRVIKVYGKLAKHLGQRSFKAVARTPADAVKFLLANFPSLRSVLSEGEYRVSVGKHSLPIGDHPEFMGYPVAGSEPIRIAPVISGAGGSTTQILVGVALVAVSLAVPAAALGLKSMTAIGLAGGSLILGGVAQMLTPIPDTPEMDSDPRENFSFSGVQNVSRSGVVVPVIYGEVITGSITISAGLNVDKVDT